MPRSVTHALGVDIGSDSIKAVELRQTAAGIRLVSRPTLIPTPVGSVSGGVVVEETAVGDALADMIASHEFTTRKVIASVGGETSVAVRIATMPLIERKKFLLKEFNKTLPKLSLYRRLRPR